MNTPNQIPEEVLKTWEETAITKYQFPFEDMDVVQNQKILTLRKSYLQGRQDEWERQREEVNKIQTRLKYYFIQSQMCVGRSLEVAEKNYNDFINELTKKHE